MATNSFLGSNSYLNPKPTTPQGGLKTYSGAQLGQLSELQPILQDLVKPTEMANKYLKQTYSGDPTAIENRLKEYQFYDPSKLGGLASYFSPKAATTYQGNLVFKPAEFEKLQSNLSGLSSADAASLKNILGSYKPIGTLNDQTFYNKSDLEKALSGYGAVSADDWKKYSGYSSLAGLKPVATIGGQNLFTKDDALKLAGVKGAEDYINKLNALIPATREEIYQGGPSYFFGTKTGPTPEEQGYKARTITNNAAFATDDTGRVMYDDYGRPVLKEGYSTPETVEYYKTYDIPRLNYDTFMQQYGATPKEGWSDANTKYAGEGLQMVNGQMVSNNPLQKWLSDPSYLPTGLNLYGAGTPEDIQRGFNILQRMSPQNIGEFWYLDPETQKGMLQNPAAALQQMKQYANPANRDWLSIGAEGGFNTINAYKWNPNTGLTVDPSQYMDIHDEKSWTKPLSILGSVLSFTPLAPLGVAMNVAAAAANKNPLGAFASVLPMLPIGGTIGGALNSGLGLGLGQAGINALGSGVLGAGMGALGGGGLKGALTGGIMGGLGSYAGSTLGDYFKGSSPFVKGLASTGLKGGLGALSAALKGKDIGQGALGGLASGALSSVGSNLLRAGSSAFNPWLRRYLG